MSEEMYWLALADSPLAPDRILAYLREGHSIASLWNAHAEDLHRFFPDSVDKFLHYRSSADLKELSRLLDSIKREGVELLPISHHDYPEQLRNIVVRPQNSPPILLLKRGRLREFSRCVAVAGTRQCTDFGREMAEAVGAALAERGYTVVSGLARGIDMQAHLGALDAGGKTVAVLAWMRPVYPRENTALLDTILESGACVSERYLAPQGMAAHLFIERNRITSGLADALVIIESRRSGGTIWQFDFAKEQQRRIFVLKPPDLESPIGKGFTYFTRNGAVAFSSTDELVEKLESPADQKENLHSLDSRLC